MCHLLRFFVLMAAFALGAVSTVSAAVPKVFSQAPCATNPCLSIGWPNTPPTDAIIRSFTFTLPGPGTVFVDFNGTMQCHPDSWSADGDFGVVDLATQIVTGAGTVANANGPSGGHHAMRLITPGALYPKISTAVNLHSTRSITYGVGGVKTVYFKLHTLRMDQFMDCSIFNATFTVLYFP
jgi:hypothetical protein